MQCAQNLIRVWFLRCWQYLWYWRGSTIFRNIFRLDRICVVLVIGKFCSLYKHRRRDRLKYKDYSNVSNNQNRYLSKMWINKATFLGAWEIKVWEPISVFFLAQWHGESQETNEISLANALYQAKKISVMGPLSQYN